MKALIIVALSLGMLLAIAFRLKTVEEKELNESIGVFIFSAIETALFITAIVFTVKL